MLDSDLFEVLAPVLRETHLLLALLIKLAHDVVETLLEALLEDSVIFVPIANNGLMMHRVLHFHLTSNLVLDAFTTLSGTRI